MADRPDTTPGPAPAIAYSYLRLSSKRQANRVEGERYRDGFRRQIELRDEYLNENPHLTLDTKFNLHDIGVSAYTRANIAAGGTGKLRLFVDEVEAGRIAPGSYLLVESLDRVSRADINIAQELLLRLVNNGIIVRSIADKQTYSATSEPMQFIISIVYLMRAHEESVIKADRLRKTWIRKRADIGNRKLTARIPSWLKVDGNGFSLHEQRAAIVVRIFTQLSHGMGRDAIARELNRDGVPTWGKGREWYGGVVQKITDTRSVLGEFRPHRMEPTIVKGIVVGKRVPAGDVIPDYYPAVIDQELWDAARLKADKKRLGKAPNAGGRQGTRISNLFGMVATCAECGAPMNYRDRGKRSTVVLVCSSNRAGTCPNDVRIPYRETEDGVLTWFLHLDLEKEDAGEMQRLEQSLREALALRDGLQAEAETLMRGFARDDRFAAPVIERIRGEVIAAEAAIAETSATLATLRQSGNGDGREPALSLMWDLERGDAPDHERYAARVRVRQMLRDAIASMRCDRVGHVDIVAIDGSKHRFRDGYWLHDGRWHPSGYGLFGLAPKITRKEEARRRAWLEPIVAAYDSLDGGT